MTDYIILRQQAEELVRSNEMKELQANRMTSACAEATNQKNKMEREMEEKELQQEEELQALKSKLRELQRKGEERERELVEDKAQLTAENQTHKTQIARLKDQIGDLKASKELLETTVAEQRLELMTRRPAHDLEALRRCHSDVQAVGARQEDFKEVLDRLEKSRSCTRKL